MQRIIASARVLCSGHLHTISLTKNGALVFHDHPYLREELAFAALGGELPHCLKVLLAWRQGKVDLIPYELRLAFDKTRSTALKRAMERNVATPDPLTIPFAVRIKERVVKTARHKLMSCTYRKAQEHWSRGKHYVNVSIGDPYIAGYSRWERLAQNSYIDVTIPLTWLTRVYKRGLAEIDGRFVLDVLDENKRGILVLAGRRGKEFEVYPCRAWVVRKADGTYRIRRWLRAPLCL